MPCCPPPRAWTGEYAAFLLLPPPPSHPSRPPAPPAPSGPRAYPLIPLSARTTIRSADVSPSRIASEKIGLAPAPQLLGPAMLQSRELVASSWHGHGRFRVNFIRGFVALLHRVLRIDAHRRARPSATLRATYSIRISTRSEQACIFVFDLATVSFSEEWLKIIIKPIIKAPGVYVPRRKGERRVSPTRIVLLEMKKTIQREEEYAARVRVSFKETITAARNAQYWNY